MKTILLALLGLFSATFLEAATLQLHTTKVGDEGAIQLSWVSAPNAVYRIEYASSIEQTNTTWHTLYEDYPSHG